MSRINPPAKRAGWAMPTLPVAAWVPLQVPNINRTTIRAFCMNQAIMAFLPS